MALPWQADFADCKQEDEDDIGTTWGWWPAQRPDEVAVGQGPRQTWTRSRAGGNADALDDDAERHRWMVDHWAKLGFVMRKGRSSEEFEETERDPDL
jgi:hypothetical protein